MLTTIVNTLLLSVLIPYIIDKFKQKEFSNIYYIFLLLFATLWSTFVENDPCSPQTSVIVLKIGVLGMFFNYWRRKFTGQIPPQR